MEDTEKKLRKRRNQKRNQLIIGMEHMAIKKKRRDLRTLGMEDMVRRLRKTRK